MLQVVGHKSYEVENGKVSEQNILDISGLGLVEEYSGLDLTYEKDRLPALSGLAKLVERFDPERYLVGIWEKDLVYQLLWDLGERRMGNGIRMPKVDDGFPREEKKEKGIYAPTFSWTAWTKKVHYRLPDESEQVCEILESYSVVPDAKVNPYRQVSDAHIRLKGEIFPLEIIFKRVKHVEIVRNTMLEDGTYRTEDPAFDPNYPFPRISLDVHRENWEKLLFFKLLRGKKMHCLLEKELGYFGLILEAAGAPGTYRRVGVATEIPISWVEYAEYEMEATIV